jgi:hypothetical protein
MSRLQLIVKKPGSLLAVFLRADISLLQYQQIILLLSQPDQYQVTEKPRMGFRPVNTEGGTNSAEA